MATATTPRRRWRIIAPNLQTLVTVPELLVTRVTDPVTFAKLSAKGHFVVMATAGLLGGEKRPSRAKVVAAVAGAFSPCLSPTPRCAARALAASLLRCCAPEPIKAAQRTCSKAGACCVSRAAASDGASCCVCWLRADARRAGASALVACVGLTATSSRLPGTTVLSPLFTPNTKITLQWNGLPEDYKFDPFVDSEHTDDYHTKDNKDAWGPKVRPGTFLPHAKTGADAATLCAGAQETVRAEKGRAQIVECGADGVVCGFGAWRFSTWY